MERQRRPRDVRDHAAQTKRRFVAGGLLLIILVGSVLIALTYGTPAAGCGLAFFLAALLPVGMILVFLLLIERIVAYSTPKEERPEDENQDPS